MRVLVLLLIAGVAVCQTPKDTPPGNKVDKAAAYYHFMLAALYADSLAPGNAEKVSENLKAAREADPAAPARVPAQRPSFPMIFDHPPRPLPTPKR